MGRSVYTSICTVCNKKFILKYKTYYKRKRKNVPLDICSFCVRSQASKKLINSFTKEELSNRMKAVWDNRSIEEREEHNKKVSVGLNNRTPEQKAITSQKQKDAHSKRTPEENKAINEKISISNKRYWENMNPLIKELRILESIRNGKEGMENLTPDQRKIRNEKISNASKNMHKNMNKDKKDNMYNKISRSRKEREKNLTIEEFNNECINKAIKYNNNNLNRVPKTDTEKYFANDLKSRYINYICGYSSIIKYNNFNKEFPYNPVLDTDRISPCHKWDFLIKTKNGDIFVDIDGNLHDSNSSHGNVTYNKISFNQYDSIKFNDSKRPYQTDNLDSYIIQCHNNIIDDNTPVIHIRKNKSIDKSNEYVTYKEFINYLGLMNTVDIKELYK